MKPILGAWIFRKRLHNTVESYLWQEYQHFISDGAMCMAMFAAENALKLKKEYPEISWRQCQHSTSKQRSGHRSINSGTTWFLPGGHRHGHRRPAYENLYVCPGTRISWTTRICCWPPMTGSRTGQKVRYGMPGRLAFRCDASGQLYKQQKGPRAAMLRIFCCHIFLQPQLSHIA